jgi:molybdate transport system substrate-binding protein
MRPITLKPFLLLGFLLLCGSLPLGAEPALRVSAASSLADVLKVIHGNFTQSSGIKVELNLGASSVLARQIEEGAPADVFISADLAKMDHLDAIGLLTHGTRKNHLSNTLVVILPVASALVIRSVQDLIHPTISRIATGNPHAVPVGVYAKRWLEREDLWKNLQSKIVATDNVRAALAAVESGNVDVGIVYKTDATLSKKVEIAFEVPADPAHPITYPMAVLKNAAHPQQALQYLQFLNTPASKASFSQFGFIVLPESDDSN